MGFSELKENARKSLKGNYKDAIIMLIFLFLISFVAGFIGSLLDNTFGFTNEQTIEIGTFHYVSKSAGLFTSIFTLIETGLLGFGIYSYFLKRSRDKKVTWKEIFSQTNLFVYFIIISLLVGLFTTLWSLLLIIPGIIAALSYSQVFFVKLDNPDIGYMDAIKKSKELMKGHKWDYFLFNLSFIGWVILGIFTLGILYFWLIPYMSVAQCNFYNKLIEK